MDDNRTPRRTHWYDPGGGGVEMWGTIYRLKREYDFRDWHPAVIVGLAVLIAIVLAAWLAHLPPVLIYAFLLADLALTGIVWNTSARS
jgi:hypothetical protein